MSEPQERQCRCNSPCAQRVLIDVEPTGLAELSKYAMCLVFIVCRLPLYQLTGKQVATSTLTERVCVRRRDLSLIKLGHDLETWLLAEFAAM